MAITPLPFQKPIQMWVTGAFGKQVTPLDIKQTPVKNQPTQWQQKQSVSQFWATIKQKYPQYADMSDQELWSKMIQKYPVYQDMVSEQLTTTEKIQNVWEWLASYAWWLPKVISETGILDKPVARLQELTAKWLSKLTGKEYKVKEWWPTFSQFAAWSQVGWDPESKIAKRVETWADVLTMAGWLSAAAKWLWKRATKKWIEEVVSSKWTQRQMAEAIAEWRVKPWATWIKKFLLGSKPQVIEKQSIQNAAKTISSEIKNPAYKQPTKLYEQIDNLIETKAKWISSELKDIKIGSFTKDKANTYKLIENGILKNDAVNKLMTNKEINSLKNAIQSIKKAKTADDLWEARKILDLSTPDSVKKASSVSSDILQYRNSIWRQARSEINDLIENAAEKFGKWWVKNTFKSMSELYQVQDNILSKAGKIVKWTSWLLSSENLKRAAIWGAWLYWGNKLLDILQQ